MNRSTSGLWTEPCYVYTHDANAAGSMSFGAVARYFQEAAWHQAESLGFGFERANELQQYWVLVRLTIRFDRFPSWGEKLVVETWPRGVDRLWAFREYQVRDADNAICCAATSSWMIMDARSHRPLKPEIVAGAMPYLIEKQAIGRTAPRLECDGPWKEAGKRIVRYSDQDVNGHMNNSRYIDWVMDAYHSMTKGAPSRELSVNYLAESHENEKVAIYVCKMAGSTFVKGEREGDGKVAFMAELG